MAQSYKRKIIFINKHYQGKLILSTFLFFCGGCLLFIVLLALFSADTLTISYVDNDIQFGKTPIMLVKQMLTANWILLAIGGVALVFSSMILSHRIAGPLYRFELALNHMNDGDLGDVIRLRQKDEGKQLAAKINQFNTNLSQSVRTAHLSTSAIDALLEQTEALNLPQEEKENLASLCWSLREHNRKIKNAFSNYQPGNE